MPAFPVAGPVSVLVELVAGALNVTAADTDELTVEVSPTNPAKGSHVRSAEQTRVEFSGGRLVVKQPKTLSHYTMFGSGISVDVTLRVPVGSALTVESPYASVRVDGRLGATSIRTSYGDVTLDEASEPVLRTGYCDISANRLVGRTELVGAGSIRVAEIDGPARVKNKYEGTQIGVITGALEVNASYGDIEVDHALGSVVAKTAYGKVRLGEVVRGAVELGSSYGQLEIGIRPGTAAWLDLSAAHGVVRNALEAASAPDPAADGDPVETVEVRGRTSWGDILVRRAAAN